MQTSLNKRRLKSLSSMDPRMYWLSNMSCLSINKSKDGSDRSLQEPKGRVGYSICMDEPPLVWLADIFGWFCELLPAFGIRKSAGRRYSTNFLCLIWTNEQNVSLRRILEGCTVQCSDRWNNYSVDVKVVWEERNSAEKDRSWTQI